MEGNELWIRRTFSMLATSVLYWMLESEVLNFRCLIQLVI